MDVPSETLRRFEERREVIARNWYEAISGTGYAAKSSQEVRQDLKGLAGQLIDLLTTDPLDAAQSEEIGVALARLHYIQAEALGGSLEVLGQQLRDGQPDEGADEYLSRLATLLGRIATGFVREACRTVLTEQETIRAAMVAEIEQSGRALLRAQEELEQRVEERTADLARSNQELLGEVTERRRVEGALRESEEQYRRLVENMQEVVYAVDPSGEVTYASPSVEALLGLEPADMIGRRIAEFFPPEDLSGMQEGFQSVLAGQRQSNVYRLTAPSGDVRWVQTSSRPVFDGSRVVGVHGLLVDITERRRAEEALRTSEERWRLLVKSAPVLVVTVGRDLTIQFMNRERGDDPTQVQRLLGKDMLGYVVPEHADATAEAIRQVFETGSSGYLEIPVYNRLGERVWYGAHLGPLRSDGQVVEVMLVARDVTEQKKVAEIKDNLIRDVSHELRTPLAKVQMSLELLGEMLEDEDLDRERAIRVSGFATRSTERMLRTVENILDLSRLEAGTWPHELQLIRPRMLIQDAILYATPLGAAKGLELAADLPESLPAIRGDWDKLYRVLRNLLYNAIKFSDEGKIVVTAEERGGELVIGVRDQGQGILPENLERIFQRFFQEKTRHLGAGLGLAICKAIVEEHGGRIWAESAGRDQGATLRFTVPAQAEEGGEE
jgi:PAS domain S-box-containing protein